MPGLSICLSHLAPRPVDRDRTEVILFDQCTQPLARRRLGAAARLIGRVGGAAEAVRERGRGYLGFGLGLGLGFGLGLGLGLGLGCA